MDVYLEEIVLFNERIINMLTKSIGGIYGLKKIFTNIFVILTQIVLPFHQSYFRNGLFAILTHS